MSKSLALAILVSGLVAGTADAAKNVELPLVVSKPRKLLVEDGFARTASGRPTAA